MHHYSMSTLKGLTWYECYCVIYFLQKDLFLHQKTTLSDNRLFHYALKVNATMHLYIASVFATRQFIYLLRI